jgi:hypothetical protein
MAKVWNPSNSVLYTVVRTLENPLWQDILWFCSHTGLLGLSFFLQPIYHVSCGHLSPNSSPCQLILSLESAVRCKAIGPLLFHPTSPFSPLFLFLFISPCIFLFDFYFLISTSFLLCFLIFFSLAFALYTTPLVSVTKLYWFTTSLNFFPFLAYPLPRRWRSQVHLKC